MRGFNATWVEVLSGAIETARAVLRDLEGPEVPARLSKVAAHQGGRLPPPLAARLLRELDENDWFREKVAEEWDGEGEGASDLFLQRPGAWWLGLTTLVETATQDGEQRRAADLKVRIEQIEAKRATAAKRVKEYKKAAADAGRAAKTAVESAKKAAEQRYSAELADAAARRVELEVAEGRLVERESEHRELQDAFDALRSRFAKIRHGRFEEREQAGGSRSIPSDPVKLARMLDRQAAEFGRDMTKPVAVPHITKEQLVLASGIRPDSSDAIRWLVALDRPVVVLVDGYNTQFHINRGDFTSGSARRHLVDVLQRLRSTAVAKHRVVVVYDSTLPGDRDARTSTGGVEVRFAVEERIADEEIVEMAGNLDRAVVITSDRAVREEAEAQGAVVLWSESLERWLHRA